MLFAAAPHAAYRAHAYARVFSLPVANITAAAVSFID
jgi:hypothetical protein